MPPKRINLSDYARHELAYESGSRFCIQKGEALELKSYEIDVSSKKQRSYFKDLFVEYAHIEGQQSADGLFLGRVQRNGHEISVMIVVELEGKGEQFTNPRVLGQIKNTILHFCESNSDSNLIDDGKKHHKNSKDNPNLYPINRGHYVIGLVIGASHDRNSNLISYRCGEKNYPIIAMDSRSPNQENFSLDSLLSYVTKYIGIQY
jgi:hypothetical protein